MDDFAGVFDYVEYDVMVVSGHRACIVNTVGDQTGMRADLCDSFVETECAIRVFVASSGALDKFDYHDSLSPNCDLQSFCWTWCPSRTLIFSTIIC